MTAELENHMTCSQRIHAYTKLQLEDDLTKQADKNLQNWPHSGKISFENVTMKYRDNLKPSLNNLTFEVQPQMKIGIVGRTGAGKSSIL